MMVKYRIPMTDKDALAKLRVKDPKKDKPIVKSWTIILPDNVAVVETEKEVKGLEKYKV